MELHQYVLDVADILREYDAERPIHKEFKPGIGPFGEPQLVKELSRRLNLLDDRYITQTKRIPDMLVNQEWAIEFKIVRPFGDNGEVAENWSVNMLHPYEGNVSLIGDAIKLKKLENIPRKAVFVIGFEHNPPKICLDPLLQSFELIVKQVIGLPIGTRIEESRVGLIHPEHQVVRCVCWEVL